MSIDSTFLKRVHLPWTMTIHRIKILVSAWCIQSSERSSSFVQVQIELNRHDFVVHRYFCTRKLPNCLAHNDRMSNCTLLKKIFFDAFNTFNKGNFDFRRTVWLLFCFAVRYFDSSWRWMNRQFELFIEFIENNEQTHWNYYLKSCEFWWFHRI